MKGYTAKVGLRKAVWDEPSWQRTFLPDDRPSAGLMDTINDDDNSAAWEEFLDYQATHLSPMQVKALQWWGAKDCPHTHVTDDTSHGGHDTLCHDCGRAGV